MRNHDQRRMKKVSGRLKFLFFVFGLYGATAVFNPALTLEALEYFAGILAKVLPILALVFLILFFINMFLDPAGIKKHLGTSSGMRGWFYAVAGGILISGPPYVLYPMLGELKRHGARIALLAVMLYNRNVKIYFIPAIIYYFGLRYTMVLSGYILLFSLLNGKLLELLVSDSGSR